MRTRRFFLLAALGVALVAATAAAAPPVERAPVVPARVTDKDGNVVTVRDVSRIVPLNGDIAETVFALRLGKNVVGTDISATYPAAANRLHSIGYQSQLNAEGILSLRPTVVIGSATAGPPAVIEQLRGAGVTVVILPESEDIMAGPFKLRAVGKALGLPRRGEQLARQVEQQIAVARAEGDLNLAAAYADLVAILSEGRLAACGLPWEVLTERRLSALFAHPVVVIRHPVRGCPLVLPGGNSIRTADAGKSPLASSSASRA